MTLPPAPVRDNTERQRYEMPTETGLAFATYRQAGDVLLVPHTEVPRAEEGRGLGSILVRGMLDDMRARGLKVRPLCPFVSGFLRRHPEYRDLIG